MHVSDAEKHNCMRLRGGEIFLYAGAFLNPKRVLRTSN